MKRRLRLWWNRVRLDVRWKRDGWRSHLILHERFQNIIRKARATFTAIGLLVALIEFSSVWIAFAVAVAIWLVTRFIEKTIFSYNSMFVHAMPSFEIVPDLWLGAMFGFAQPNGEENQVPFVGWMMADAAYARNIHRLLLQWTYGELNDKEKNICVSVVVLNDAEYIFYLYPSMDRKSATVFFDAVEAERRKKSLSDVHMRNLGMLVFGKRCQITPNSYLLKFRRRYRDGVPYLFRLALLGPNNQPQPIPGIPNMVLHNLKIKSRDELTEEDVEYGLVRMGPS